MVCTRAFKLAQAANASHCDINTSASIELQAQLQAHQVNFDMMMTINTSAATLQPLPCHSQVMRIHAVPQECNTISN
jgi:hypothetical protein